MKKTFYYLSLLLGLVFGMTMFTACGGGDDDDGGGTYSQENLQGVWSGETADKMYRIAIAFFPNNTVKSTMYELKGQNYVARTSTEGTYVFDTNTGVVSITYSDDNTTETFPIAAQTYSTFTLYIGDTPFYMTRYTDSGSGSSGSGGSGYDGSGYDDDDDNGGSSSRTKCPYCDGSGDCHNYKTYSANKLYCGGDGKCYRCDGKGYWTSGTGGTINCESCDSPGYNSGLLGNSGRLGNGKCAQCHGSGKCQNCGGDGYI